MSIKIGKRYTTMKNTYILWALIPACVVLTSTSHARVTTLSGGVSTGYDYFTRTYDNEVDSETGDSTASAESRDDDYSRLLISPYITIVSKTVRDTAEFSYAPSFRYDFDESENDVDHSLTLDYTRALSKRWDITLGDSFTQSDDFSSLEPAIDSETGEIISEQPGADPVTGDRLKDDRGRRSHYTNTLSVGTEYTYLEDSALSVDYSWNVLRNDDDESELENNYQDYDKHNFGIALKHRVNSQWKLSGELRYVRGLYDSSLSDSVTRADDLELELGELDSDIADLESALADLDPDSADFETNSAALESELANLNSQSDDIETELAELESESDDVDEFDASLGVAYQLNPHHSLNANYSYSLSDYESDLRADSEIHDITFGWAWAVSPKLNISLGAGPTYTKTDGQSGNWDNNGNFTLNYRIEKGSISLAASGGQDFENFSGTSDRRLTEYWQLQANLNYSIFERTTLTAYASYRNEDSEEAGAVTTDSDPDSIVSVNSEDYGVGMGVSYQIHQHWSANLSYGYAKKESDIAEDEYDDHSVYVSLTYQDDFFRW